jgi:hypothetical protein
MKLQAAKGLHYQRVAVGPVVAVLGVEADNAVQPACDEAVAVMLDFVDPTFS